MLSLVCAASRRPDDTQDAYVICDQGRFIGQLFCSHEEGYMLGIKWVAYAVHTLILQ